MRVAVVLASIPVLGALGGPVSAAGAAEPACTSSAVISDGQFTGYLVCDPFLDPQPVPADCPTATIEVAATVEPTSTAPGGVVSVGAAAFAPGSDVTIYLCSTPRVLATVAADQAGELSSVATIPTDVAPGQHWIVAVGVRANGLSQRALAQLTVVPAQPVAGTLPVTGTDEGQRVAIALAMIVLGIAAVVGAGRGRKRGAGVGPGHGLPGAGRPGTAPQALSADASTPR